MTAPIETETPPDDNVATAGGPADTEAPPADDADQADRKPWSREQRYRLELREAQAERDALTARVEAMQTRELHRLLADTLANPEDISLSGLELSDFIREEDGELDTEAVAEAAASILSTRPGLAKDYRPVGNATDPSQAMSNGRVNRQPTFADLLS